MIHVQSDARGGVRAVYDGNAGMARGVWFIGLLLGAALAGAVWGGWVLALASALSLAYPIASLCFRKTSLEADPQRIQWRDRPFPLRPSRELKTREAKAWVYGETPKRRGESQAVKPTFVLGVARLNGKIMPVFRGVRDFARLGEVAEELGGATGIAVKRRLAMKGRTDL